MTENERDENGWSRDSYGNGYSRRSRGRGSDDVDIDMDGYDINVRIDGGYGYETYSASVSIPTGFVVEMLRAAGYTITPPGESR